MSEACLVVRLDLFRIIDILVVSLGIFVTKGKERLEKFHHLEEIYMKPEELLLRDMGER